MILKGLPWKQRSFCHFWDCTQVLHFGLFCWLWWLLHFFKGFLQIKSFKVWNRDTKAGKQSFIQGSSRKGRWIVCGLSPWIDFYKNGKHRAVIFYKKYLNWAQKYLEFIILSRWLLSVLWISSCYHSK